MARTVMAETKKVMKVVSTHTARKGSRLAFNWSKFSKSPTPAGMKKNAIFFSRKYPFWRI